MPLRVSKATRLLEEGRRFHRNGEDSAALIAYRQVAELRPRWSVPWYNIGLVHKYRREWQLSFDANLRAHELDPSDEAACWNLGIAATAVGDWATARRAWRTYGIDLPAGEGPIDFRIGPTPIRVGLQTQPEVVWTDRIDPARAIIRSVPTPACGRRFGDLVLHDGAPNGYRVVDGQERAVFDELDVIAPSDYATYEAVVEGVAATDVDALEDQAAEHDMPLENWSDNVRMLCKACSEGRPDSSPGHDHAPRTPSLRGELRLGISARDGDRAREGLSSWVSRAGGALLEFTCVLEARARH